MNKKIRLLNTYLDTDYFIPVPIWVTDLNNYCYERSEKLSSTRDRYYKSQNSIKPEDEYKICLAHIDCELYNHLRQKLYYVIRPAIGMGVNERLVAVDGLTIEYKQKILKRSIEIILAIISIENVSNREAAQKYLTTMLDEVKQYKIVA